MVTIEILRLNVLMEGHVRIFSSSQNWALHLQRILIK